MADAGARRAWWSKETVAVVTGANRGIGHALAARLAEHGLTVVLTARDDDRGEAAAAPLRDRGLPVVYRRLDVSDPASVAAFAGWLRDTLGGLDILVRHSRLPPRLLPASMSVVSASFQNQSQIFGAPSPKLFRPFCHGYPPRFHAPTRILIRLR
jgi:NAD(P)-dependent dehydrogenase (short-subunit alcohol dehydrogenase family)